LEQALPYRQSEAGGRDERRRTRRFEIKVPVRFSWIGSDGTRSTGKGKTRDISIHGAFIWAWPVPLPGDAVEVKVEVPSFLIGGTSLRLHGNGTVLRVEPPDAQAHGFAIAVDFQTTGTEAMSGCGSETNNSPLS
jgi:hypothetical protein